MKYSNSQNNNYKSHLEEVKRIPLTPPNVESATNIGIVQAMTPYSRSANTFTIFHTDTHTHTLENILTAR